MDAVLCQGGRTAGMSIPTDPRIDERLSQSVEGLPGTTVGGSISGSCLACGIALRHARTVRHPDGLTSLALHHSIILPLIFVTYHCLSAFCIDTVVFVSLLFTDESIHRLPKHLKNQFYFR